VRVTRRLLTGLSAAIAVSLALASGASGQTVYNYVYSGQYIDGSGSDKGQFTNTSAISNIAWDKTNQRLLIAVGGSEPYVVSLKENGEPAPFSGLETGVDTISPTPSQTMGGEPALDVDNTGGPNAGNFYLAGVGFGGGQATGFTAAGNKLPLWPRTVENLCGITVGPEGNPWTMGSIGGAGLRQFSPDGEPTGTVIFARPHSTKEEPPAGFEPDVPCRQRLDSQSNFYGAEQKSGFTRWVKYDPDGNELYELSQNNNANQGMAVDLSNDDVFTIEGVSGEVINHYDREGKKLETFGAADPANSFSGIDGFPNGIAVNPATHDVWVANRRNYSGTRRVEKFVRELPGLVVPTVGVHQVEGADLQTTTATLRGSLNPDGLETETCQFKWGLTQAVTNTVPCDQGQNLTGSSDIGVTATVPVTKGKKYFYRLQSQNKANHRVMVSGPKRFIAQGKPVISLATVDRVNTDGARFNADIDPNGGNTTYQFEYGSGPGFEHSTPTLEMPKLTTGEHIEQLITGLTPGTEYHFRLSITNEAGTTISAPQNFLTYAPDPGIDSCPNALARQQSGSSRLLDCRAYELVSAVNAGGYDVESDLIPGQQPLVGPPGAKDRVLYSVHSGTLPGATGSPTNYGRDPYVATRFEDGEWNSEYVGLPADGMSQKGPFGSPLLGTDGSLSQFAFGGQNICDPCFADGSTNVPLRRADGSLVKGMAGSSNPAANPSGLVAKPFSDDGTHFVFGSLPKFEDGGDAAGSIYDRNLITNTTQVVSTTPAGTAIAGGDVGELDISEDGQRIVIGQRISTDARGNDYWHLYMHLGTSPNSVDLTEGATGGAIFAGMNGAGTRVFMTTKDKLLGADTDVSADIYEAEVGGGGAVDLRLVTTKGGVPSNDDSCAPPGLPDSWNVASGPGKCDALAFAGGAGVARGDGTLYFASPEQLEGVEGALNQGNLYFVEPDGDPQFAAVLDTSEGKPGPQPPGHPIEDEEFGGTFSGPEGLTVDQFSGDVYVAEFGTGKIHRFTSAGAPKDFTAGPGAGSNEIGGFEWLEPGLAQIAVDNSPGPANGRIYVVDTPGFVSRISVYAPSGALLTTLSGTNAPGGFGITCGIAIDQANGDLYVGDYYGHIWRYTPSASTVAESDYSGGVSTGGFSSSCHVAPSGTNVYTNLRDYGEVVKYQKSDFAVAPPEPESPLLASGATGLSSDQSNGDVYVDQGNKISVYDVSGALKETIGAGELFLSQSTALNEANDQVYATAGGEIVVEFGAEQTPYVPLDNQGIVNATRQSETHTYGDFQVSPDGRYAAFGTKQPLTGYNTLGFEQVYRYDSEADQFDCASCAPSGAVPGSHTGLPDNGLALTDDGRVFYTSEESFVLRDTNARNDVYEWWEGKIQLISLGLGPDDSRLLTVSPDGTDAFFFTRDTLVTDDENGSTVKIYDARVGGGAVHDPSLLPCAASDECHGPGTQAPPPLEINSQKGSGHSFHPPASKKCRKGTVKRKGKCVKKKKRKLRKQKKGKRGRRG
jgi:sugar lactone lactonase YvrE